MSEPNIVTTQGVVDALAAWVSSTLAGHTYPAPDGTYKEVRVFTHNLPEPEGDDDADLAFCPFCIVHAGSGTVEDWGRQTMPIVLLFCVRICRPACGLSFPRYPARGPADACSAAARFPPFERAPVEKTFSARKKCPRSARLRVARGRLCVLSACWGKPAPLYRTFPVLRRPVCVRTAAAAGRCSG